VHQCLEVHGPEVLVILQYCLLARPVARLESVTLEVALCVVHNSIICRYPVDRSVISSVLSPCPRGIVIHAYTSLTWQMHAPRLWSRLPAIYLFA